jgi:Bacteriophage HK97-gp10, putative tail-component
VATEEITFDTAAFVRALGEALQDFHGDAASYVDQLGGAVLGVASALVPRRTGRLASSLILEAASGPRGPYVEVGTRVDYAMFVEFGTYKDRAQPFMRPALASVARGIKFSGGRSTRTSGRAALFTRRQRAREALRTLHAGGHITSGQAREASRQISNRIRYRRPRRRR